MACDLRLKTLLPSYLDLPGVYTHFIFLKESLMKFQCGDKHGHLFFSRAFAYNISTNILHIVKIGKAERQVCKASQRDSK